MMFRFASPFALCISVLVASGCARPVLPPIDVGNYDRPPSSPVTTGNQAETPAALTCDQAVKTAQSQPVLDLLKRAESVLSSARGQNHSPLGQAELRLRSNLSKTEEFRTTLRWQPPQYGLRAIRRQQQHASERAAKAMDLIRRAMAAAQVRQLHLEYRMADLSRREAQVDLDTLKARKDLAVAALTSGTITRAESERIDTELKLARFAYENARHATHLARARFAALIGAPPEISRCSTEDTQGSLVEHPEVVVAMEDANLSSLRADAREGEGGFWPSFLETSWQRNDGGATDQFLLELGVPLFTDRSERAAVARGQADRARGEARWIAQKVATRVRLARALLKSRLAQLASTRSALKSPQAAPAIGSPAEQARVKRLRARLQINIEGLEHAVEAARIDLQAALSIP